MLGGSLLKQNILAYCALESFKPGAHKLLKYILLKYEESNFYKQVITISLNRNIKTTWLFVNRAMEWNEKSLYFLLEGDYAQGADYLVLQSPSASFHLNLHTVIGSRSVSKRVLIPLHALLPPLCSDYLLIF